MKATAEFKRIYLPLDLPLGERMEWVERMERLHGMKAVGVYVASLSEFEVVLRREAP